MLSDDPITVLHDDEKDDISGVEVASILGVAVSMMLLSLSELDELSHFDFGGIPLILFGIASSAAAPILAKQYIFSKYQPPRTEVGTVSMLCVHSIFDSLLSFPVISGPVFPQTVYRHFPFSGRSPSICGALCV